MSVPGTGMVFSSTAIKRVLEGVVVERERALQKGLAGEGDQPDAAVPRCCTKSRMASLARCNRFGRDIARQHAARAIQHEQDVLAKQLADLRLLAPLRPRQGEADAGHRQERASAFLSARRAGLWERVSSCDEMRRGQLRELLSAAPRPSSDAGQQAAAGASTASQSQRGSAKWGLAEVHHGTRRKRVLARTSSRASNPNAASKGHWNSGR